MIKRFGWQVLVQYPFFGVAGIRAGLYQLGLLKSYGVDRAVISIGNLAWGGTGKSQLAVEVAQYIISKGKRLAVLSRGYGSPYEGRIIELDGKTFIADEAAMIKDKCPDALVYIGADRVRAARRIIERHSPDCILLDDGFQHRRLKRDLDIVVITPYDRFFREHISRLRVADVVVANRCEFLTPDEVGSFCNYVKRFCSAVVPSGYALELDSPAEGDSKPILVSAIARPALFEKGVLKAGMSIAGHIVYSDHHNFTYDDVEKIVQSAEARGANAVVCTEKDYAKLRHFENAFRDAGIRLQVCRARLRFLGDGRVLFDAIDKAIGV